MTTKQGINGPVIQLHSGQYFNFENTRHSPMPIEDIAHALSLTCRFTGHARLFYSVAEHSVAASRFASTRERQYEALMHDAHEAFIGDVSSPLKALLPDYKRLEKRVEKHVRLRFGLPTVLSSEVRLIDLRMLETERVQVMRSPHRWQCLEGVEPFDCDLQFWDPFRARQEFLNRYHLLKPTA